MNQSRYRCDVCDKDFKYIYRLLKHERLKHHKKVLTRREQNIFNKTFKCPKCLKITGNLYRFKKHLRTCRIRSVNKKCLICAKYFINNDTLIRHSIRCANQIGFGSQNRIPKLDPNSKFRLSRSAFKKFIQMYELYPEQKFTDCRGFITEYKKDLIDLIENILNRLDSIKLQICLQVSFGKQTGDIKIYSIGYFSTENFVINSIEEFESILEYIIEYIQNLIENFEENGSDWIVEDIDRLDVRIGIFNALTGGCHRPLPDELKNKKAIINIKNKSDNKCFIWSILAALFPVATHPEYVTKYTQHYSKLNLKNFKFPMNLNKIDKFEELNTSLDIGVNVFTWNKFETKKSTLKPLRQTKLNAKNIINLLLSDEHYYYIKNINRLIGNYASNYHHFCLNCFRGFRNNSKLAEHKNKCLKFKPQIAKLPKDTNKLYSFTKVEQSYKFPFVMYADFESILIKQNINISPKSQVVQKHEASGYSFIVIKDDKDIFYHNYFRGVNAIDVFLRDLKYISEKLIIILSESKEMNPLTKEQKIYHKKATICHICEKPFTSEPDLDDWIEFKVKDHDHLTGEYNGAAHTSCNLRYQLPNYVPLFFHNLKGYDSHFIISNLNSKSFSKCQIIPQNMEKFISFKLDFIQVLDSYQFLGESLGKLVENLRESGHDFPITNKIFESYQLNEYKKDLLFKKSVYPYEYVDDISKFNERCLPPKNQFYSKLNNSHITDEEYTHAINVWNEFEIQTFGEYHDFYVNLDTSLLSDVFQAFRKKIYQYYKLDACHFFSIPGLAWSAAMKYTDVRLELLTDIDMYQFCELGIRGGMSCVSKRYCKANNKYVENFNPNEETVYLTYLDFNNLYGYAMSQNLPQCEFDWTTESEYNSIDWKTIDTESNIGYILEVDLEYPSNLHDLHKHFPLCPQKCKIYNNRLSDYQLKTIQHLKQFGYRRTVTEKLMQTLDDKSNYILHFKNLQLYLKLGLKIKRIHKVLKFKQSKFLEPYIKFNTKLRKKAKNNFEKDLFKLMNNSVFGKSIQDQRKHLNIKLALTEKQASRWLIKPNFESFNILDEDKVLIKMRKTVVKLDKPIYIGFTVLELSKHLMFDCYYNCFKRYYDEDITLAYFDTDSYLFEIKTEDYYQDLANIFNDIMDFSNFSKEHFLYDKSKEKVIGYLKDEFGGQPVSEFIGLKSKLYSIKYGHKQNKRTAKGVQKSIIKKYINHDYYKNVLFNNDVYCSTMRRIQSKSHKVNTVRNTKMIFTSFDDKKYICDNGIDCLPFGHKDLVNII